MWQSLPMITCLHCGHEQQIDDYYDLGVGDTINCSKCERDMYIQGIDTIIEIDLQTENKES